MELLSGTEILIIVGAASLMFIALGFGYYMMLKD
jgi:hypothetical protein